MLSKNKMNNQFRLLSIIFLLIMVNQFAFAEVDKFRCIWRDNPSTTMTIAWNQISGKNPVLYYDTYDNGTAINNYVYNQQPDKKVISKGLNNHFVRLKNLQPNTKYYFIIKDSESKSKRYWFQTAPDNSYERLSILAGGDSRNNRKGRQNANILVAKLRPHCVVFGGDMTGLDITREWKKWFDDWQMTIAKDGRMTPIIAARGNHERSNQTLVDLFDVPNKEVHYALNLGGDLVRIYTLNTMIATGGNQRKWLENDLKNNTDAIWKMAQYHHPMRPHTAKKAEGQRHYKSWAKLFYAYQVKLVVECDAHLCKTTYPIRPTYEKGHDEGFKRDDIRGTTYIGEGCWGAPIRPADDAKKWTRAIGSFNQIKWVFINKEEIKIRTVKTDNALKVGVLTDETRFDMPKNINIWKPKTGSVITIKNKKSEIITKPGELETPTKAPIKSPKPKSKPIKKTNNKPKIKTIKQDTKVLILHDVEVEIKDKEAIVNWKTTSEPDIVICDLERSTNGIDFQTITRLQLLGNTEKEQKYELIDANFKKQNAPFIYYRIKSTLEDGTEILTAKERVESNSFDTFEKLVIENQSFSVDYDLKKAGEVSFIIYNEKGEIVFYRTYLDQKEGEQNKSIYLSEIPRGKHLLAVQLSDGEVIYRFMNE